MVSIEKFKNEFAFLSNFYESTIYVDHKQYKSVEHAYQAHKTLDEEMHEKIRNAPTAGKAKQLGMKAVLRPDWDLVKVELMRKFVELKFQNPFLRPMLIATYPAKLVEGNTWNDTFWGICRGKGQNMLGLILEEVRDKAIEEESLEK